MLKLKILCLLCVACILFSSTTTEQAGGRIAQIKRVFLANVQAFDSVVLVLQKDAKSFSGNDTQLVRLRQDLIVCRKLYKRVEWLVEYFNPLAARQLNEAAVMEVDEKDLEYTDACGLQVVEAMLWSDDVMSSKQDLLAELDLLHTNAGGLLVTAQTLETNDALIWNALRMELVRVVTLGITGFDTPESGEGIRESYNCIESIYQVVQLYESANADVNLKFSIVLDQLSENTDFNTFDRLTFIRDCYIPLSVSMLELQRGLEIPFAEVRSGSYPTLGIALNMQAGHLFTPGAIDQLYYANHSMVYENFQHRYIKTDDHHAINPERAALGRLLFFDPVLSGNGKRSCASCHDPQRAFSDGAGKSLAMDAMHNVGRNAPTLINASFNRRQFSDARAFTLESQVDSVMSNAIELHGDFEKAAAVLRKSKAYRRFFAQAFTNDSLRRITGTAIKSAIAEYERTLTGIDSRFDRFIRGDNVVITPDEKSGFNLFTGKARCATCHFMPLFNGTLPPEYVKDELEVIGSLSSGNLVHPSLDSADKGRSRLTGIHFQQFAFKVPTVRNAALTAPYMHNGIFKTLEEVVQFYNKGGALGLGLNLPNQTLSPDSLNLSKHEVLQLVAFMEMLTDTAGLTSVPASLPAIGNNRKLNGRKVGGEY